MGKHKHYDWGQVKEALFLLGFEPQRLHRRGEIQRNDGQTVSESMTVSVWHGPLNLLVDDETYE
jgi:hypothetical protein